LLFKTTGGVSKGLEGGFSFQLVFLLVYSFLIQLTTSFDQTVFLAFKNLIRHDTQITKYDFFIWPGVYPFDSGQLFLRKRLQEVIKDNRVEPSLFGRSFSCDLSPIGEFRIPVDEKVKVV